MRRYKGPVKPPRIFESAKATVCRLRDNVVYKTVDVKFTLQDAINFCVPPHTQELLYAAYEVASADSGYSGKADSSFSLPYPDAHLSIDFHQAFMFRPNSLQRTGVDPNGIESTAEELVAIYRKFDDVELLIDWMDNHAMTVGAARYYWPTILALLPDTHPVHEADGQRYKETPGVSQVLDLMREAAGTVAAALMLGDVTTPARTNAVTFIHYGRYFPLI